MVDRLSCPDAYLPNPLPPYPPFKNGLYLEEFVLRYLEARGIAKDRDGRLYLPVLFLNLTQQQGHDRRARTARVQAALDEYVASRPCEEGYFAVMQHDDGTDIRLPANTFVYGGSSGHAPLPLIYEDRLNVLSRYGRTFSALAHPTKMKKYLCSFVGSTTHPLRAQTMEALSSSSPSPSDEFFFSSKQWRGGGGVTKEQRLEFINVTLRSTFALAPRGYGRSSFRFFESLSLGAIPVYVWDDREWLPYTDVLDYSTFSLSVHVSELSTLRDRMLRLADDPETLAAMVREGGRVRSSFFSLEYLCEYIVSKKQPEEERENAVQTVLDRRVAAGAPPTTSPPVLWLTMVNAGYLDYTLNFLLSVRRVHAPNFELILYCFDDESLCRMQHEPQCVCVDARAVLARERYRRTNRFDAGLQLWNTEVYNEMMFAKLDFVDCTLQMLEDAVLRGVAGASDVAGVGYLDMDVVLLQDPTAHVVHQMQQFPHANLFFQCDEPHARACSNPAACSSVCAGLMVFRTGGTGGGADRFDGLLRYERSAMADFVHRNSDQGYIQDWLLRHPHAICTRTLPRAQFRNGSYDNLHLRDNYDIRALEQQPAAGEADCVLVHFNYLVGGDKKRKINACNMWRVDFFGVSGK